MSSRSILSWALYLAACGLVAACEDKKDLSRAELLDPENCADCHPKHFEEWRGSMHAYAADDPIFLAMNQRGQRETGGELGDFCVQCHAPMAVLEGATTDGLNLDEVPQHLKGVTCYFCHSVANVTDTHNNPLELADDLVLRGGIDSPVDNPAHKSAYSSLHDLDSPESSDLCGSCHDIFIDDFHLERTFLEWKESVFSKNPFSQSCSACHMKGSSDVVADFSGVPLRRRHAHGVPAVDTALIDWPGKDIQRELIQEELNSTVQSQICYNPQTNAMDLTITNVGAGHNFPSGAAQDRRAWVQFSATVGQEEVIRSGFIPDGEIVDEFVDDNLLRIYYKASNAQGQPEKMFWNMTALEGELLPPSVTFDQNDPAFDHSVRHSYALGANPRPDRAEVLVRLRAIDLALIDSLIASGDLDASFRDRIPTFDLEGSRVVWTPELAGADFCVP